MAKAKGLTIDEQEELRDMLAELKEASKTINEFSEKCYRMGVTAGRSDTNAYSDFRSRIQTLQMRYEDSIEAKDKVIEDLKNQLALCSDKKGVELWNEVRLRLLDRQRMVRASFESLDYYKGFSAALETIEQTINAMVGKPKKKD